MDEHDWLVERFEANRAHVRAVAYRMLGSSSEADDAVQECWLRLSRTDTSGVENLSGWLTTVVSRVCLDMLRSRQSRREEPLDPQVVIESDGDVDPEHEALLADSLGPALIVVLETLAPAERLAFVLHDMFAVPFDEIAPIVGRSPEAARQLASRARRRVQGKPAVADADLTRQREIVSAFLAAARGGDFEALAGGSRPRRRAPGRRGRGADRRVARGPRRGRGGGDVLGTGPGGTAGAGGRRRRSLCGPSAGDRRSSSTSRSPTGGSSRSTCWPTRTSWPGSTWCSSTTDDESGDHEFGSGHSSQRETCCGGEDAAGSAGDAIGGEILCQEMKKIEKELFDADWAEAKARVGEESASAARTRPAPGRRPGGDGPALGRCPEGRGCPTRCSASDRLRDVPAHLRAGLGTVVTSGSLVPWLGQASVAAGGLRRSRSGQEHRSPAKAVHRCHPRVGAGAGAGVPPSLLRHSRL